MTKPKRIRKCKSLIKTLEKIISGTKLTWAERVEACQTAIDIFCDSGSGKTNPSEQKIEW